MAHTLKPQILGHENNGHFLQTSSLETIMVSLTLEVRMGEGCESMQIAFPYPTLEPLIRHLDQKSGSTHSEEPKPEPPKKWNPQLSDAKIPLTAEWPAIQMTMGDLAKLKVGDIIPLESELIDQVQLKLGNVPKFLARLGNVADKWAVEITQIIKL
jgi:flagellar motor switch protein FliM